MRTEYVCHQCGEEFAEPKEIDFVYSEEEFPDGSKTTLSEKRTVSPCCKGDFDTYLDGGDEQATPWPREIWMSEREEHDQGVVSAVLSQHATVARWEGDKEKDREFHRYVDADILDSTEKYWRAKVEALEAENARLRKSIPHVGI